MVKGILVTTTALLIGLPVLAADYSKDRRPHHGHRPSTTFSTGGLPSYVRGVGTFSGAISALKVKGNGIYFGFNGGLSRSRSSVSAPLAPKARIINVSAKTLGSECSYEAGVCVIRP
jgi:hypothetical protein